MTRTKQHNKMATVTGQRPEYQPERKAREAYEEAEAAWLATCREQDNSRVAELSVQKAGLLKLWKEEKTKAIAAWPVQRKQWAAEIEAEEEEEAAADAAAKAEAALEEREEAPLAQVIRGGRRCS